MVPLAENRGAVVTQFTMNTIADLGLLKIDFLGLRYLTVISDAEKAVRRKEPAFDITRVSLSDEKTYRLIGSGNTDGVFQLESGGMKSLLARMKPESIEDITAAISLYRPGPMESIPKYLENRKHPEKIRYAVPALASILDMTNGCIIYQEQVMQIFRTPCRIFLRTRRTLSAAPGAKKRSRSWKRNANTFYTAKSARTAVKNVPGHLQTVSRRRRQRLYTTK